MARRWRDPSAFRADPTAAPSAHPSHRQTLALLAVLALVAGAVAIASYVIRPEKARAFDLFHGSLFLTDQTAPVAVDLAGGKPTLRLVGADKQVGVTTGHSLGVVPLTESTLLLDMTTGEFNMVDNSGFVVKHDGGGVPLARRSGDSTAFGIASTEDQAYIVRTGATGGTDVYLVNQRTVEAAINATKGITPRASTSIAEPATADPRGAVAANGDLWLLVGSPDGARTIRQLSVPANSNPGAELASSDHGTVSGSAALGTATVDGGTSSVVGVASDGRIRIFGTGSASGTASAAFRSPAGLDAVLPASNADGRLAFLLHATNGWSVVSVSTDGSELRGPSPLAGVPTDARLAPPSVSDGDLYSVDRTTGGLYRVTDAGKASDIHGYPLAIDADDKEIETRTFTDAYVIARGSRVVVNSPSHANALMLFTDGSHIPQQIVKSSAVAVNASGGAEALTKPSVNPGPPPGKNPTKGGPKPKPQAGQPINNRIDCKTVQQKPHIPVITSEVPGSRTVALTWTYPVLDPQDCYPSTYRVDVTRISNDAPDPPSSVTVQSQTGTNLSGLFPSTQYEITVTAFINGEGTKSASVRITTGKEGPAAPTGVRAIAGSDGNWTISWNSCGTLGQGCVPAQTWTVTPSFCDGRGLSSPPEPMSVTADPTTRSQGPATYKGSDDLLGRGLQFQVQGTGDQGEAGAPSAKTACVYSWTAPDRNAITLAASAPDKTASASATTTTTASVSFDGSAAHALGGVGGSLTYRLLSGGSVVDTVGPTSATTVQLQGITAAQNYQVAVYVAPPRHQSDGITVGPVDVQPAVAQWPNISVSVSRVQNDGATSADVTMDINGVSSAGARGERFSVTWVVDCGSTETPPYSRSAVDPSDPLTFSLDRVDHNWGSCTVKIQDLREAAGPGVYGGTPAPDIPRSESFQVDQPTLTGVSASDFEAQWDGSDAGLSKVQINYTGGNPVLGLLASWSVSITDPSGDDCGGYKNSPKLSDVKVPQSCVDKDGASGDGWQVVISVTSIGNQSQGPFTLGKIDGGAAPTYNPPPPAQCDIAKGNLTATWSGSQSSPSVTVSAGDGDAVKDCSDWVFTVVGPQTPNCGTASGDSPGQTIAVTCTDDVTAGTWSVSVTYKDLDGSTKPDTIGSIGGSPPS